MSNDAFQTLAVLAVMVGVIVLWQWLRRSQFVGVADAQRLLAAGARVVDVRTPGEFAAGHVRGAVNVPLDGVVEGIRKIAPNPATPLLLHCHSGGRSGIARMLLRRSGYTEVHNLGSLGRARSVVG